MSNLVSLDVYHRRYSFDQTGRAVLEINATLDCTFVGVVDNYSKEASYLLCVPRHDRCLVWTQYALRERAAYETDAVMGDMDRPYLERESGCLIVHSEVQP